MSKESGVSDLFALENQVGDYRGPRLGYAEAQEGGGSDMVYSPGYTGPLAEREAAMDRYGGVVQLGGFMRPNVLTGAQALGKRGSSGRRLMSQTRKLMTPRVMTPRVMTSRVMTSRVMTQKGGRRRHFRKLKRLQRKSTHRRRR